MRMYIKFDIYNEYKERLLDKVKELHSSSKISLEEAVDMASLIYEMGNEGMTGEVEIFKEVRDKVEEAREYL